MMMIGPRKSAGAVDGELNWQGFSWNIIFFFFLVQKPRIIPPLTKSGGCITGTKPDQRHKKKKSPLILKHNSVKNSGIL